jgi:hypothetical protein
LAVLGYRLYKVSVQTRTSVIENIVIVTRDRLEEADQIRMLDLDDKISFARRAE